MIQEVLVETKAWTNQKTSTLYFLSYSFLSGFSLYKLKETSVLGWKFWRQHQRQDEQLFRVKPVVKFVQ